MIEKIDELYEWWPIQSEILITGFSEVEKSAEKLDSESILMDTDLSRLLHDDLRWYLYQQMDGLDENSEKSWVSKNNIINETPISMGVFY